MVSSGTLPLLLAIPVRRLRLPETRLSPRPLHRLNLPKKSSSRPQILPGGQLTALRVLRTTSGGSTSTVKRKIPEEGSVGLPSSLALPARLPSGAPPRRLPSRWTSPSVTRARRPTALSRNFLSVFCLAESLRITRGQKVHVMRACSDRAPSKSPAARDPETRISTPYTGWFCITAACVHRFLANSHIWVSDRSTVAVTPCEYTWEGFLRLQCAHTCHPTCARSASPVPSRVQTCPCYGALHVRP